MLKPLFVCVALSAVVVSSSLAATTDVVGWRGDGRGSFSVQNPLTEWSSEKSVLWSVKLEDWSNASPMIMGDKIFTCSEKMELICLSRESGAVTWRKGNSYADLLEGAEAESAKARAKELVALDEEISPLKKELGGLERKVRKKQATDDDKARITVLKDALKPLLAKKDEYKDLLLPSTHSVNGYSTPTPVTDGTAVFAVFGNGIVARYTTDGEREWARVVKRPSHNWGHSASPLVVDGLLLLHVSGEVIALDSATGAERWRVAGKGSWGTPVVTTIGETRVLVTTGVDLIQVKDGKVLASGIAAMPWTSPLVQEGILYVADERECSAFVLDETLITEGKSPEKRWTLAIKKDRYYASPVVFEGLLYTVNRGGTMSVVDVADGSLVYEKKLEFADGGGTVYPSPIQVGGLLFVSKDNGSTLVLKPGKEYAEVASNKLEPFRSSPVFAGNKMFVRTLNHMFCIGR